jgi:hypothetical protein
MRHSLALAKSLRAARRLRLSDGARTDAGTFVAFSAFMPIRRILAATDFSTR